MLLLTNYVSGQNLIQNPDCELPLLNGKIPNWTEVLGNKWRTRLVDPAPQHGKYYFFSGVGAETELAQTITLTNRANSISPGNMSFRFTGYVRAWHQSPPDQSQIIIEMLDNNESILQSYDLGIYNQFSEWVLVDKQLKAPPLTRKIKVRLLSHRKAGANNDGYFDNLSLVTEILPSTSQAQIQESVSVVESVISGQVIDKQTLKPVKATLSVIGEKSPQQTIFTRTNGTYNFKAPINDISIISVVENGYEPVRESISIDKSNLIKNFFLVAKPASAKPEIDPKPNEPVVLKNVLFNISTATLLPQSFPELDRLANLMQTKSTIMIRLEGHTDRIGDTASNLKLSQDRVAEVKRYLIQKGISDTRIMTRGYGDTRTICTPPCEANRRVEFVVTDQ